MLSNKDREFLVNQLSDLTVKVGVLEAKLDERDKLLALHTELIKSFQKLQDDYSDGLARAREVIKDLEEQAAQEAKAPAPDWESRPLHMSEDEEELEFLRDQGILTPDAYQEALKTFRNS